MAKKEYCFELKSSLSELDKLCRKLETVGREIKLSKKFIFEINLALDELFTNIISYGIEDDNEHVIKVFAETHRLENREAEISVTHFIKELGRRGLLGLQ